MNKLILFFTICSFGLNAQGTINVMNADNGIKTSIPTSLNTGFLPTGVLNDVLYHNGTSYVSTAGTGVTFRTLANYWVKTGNNINYPDGNVSIGAVNNRRVFTVNGLMGVPFQGNDTVVNAAADISLGFGVLSKFVKNTRANYIYTSATNIFGDPSTHLYIQAVSGDGVGDAFSGMHFVTGVTPNSSKKLSILSDGIYVPYLTSLNEGFYFQNSSGRMVHRAVGTGLINNGTSIVPDLSFINYWTKTGSNLSYDLGNVTIGSGANPRRLINNGSQGFVYTNIAPPATADWLNFGTYNAAPASSGIPGQSTHLFTSTGNVYGDPLGFTYLRLRTDSDPFSGFKIISGTANTPKFTVLSDGVYLNYINSLGAGFVFQNSSGLVSHRTFGSGITDNGTQIGLDFSAINYWTKTGSNLTYTAGNVGIGSVATLDMRLKVASGLGVDYSSSPMTVGSNTSICMGRLDAQVSNNFSSLVASVGNNFGSYIAGDLLLQPATNRNGVIWFATGNGTPTNKMAIDGSDVYFFNQSTDNAATIVYAKGSGGKLVERTVASLETDGVIGNEVTNATDGTLVRSGAGTTVSPYTLDIAAGGITNADIATGTIDPSKINQATATTGNTLIWNGTAWVAGNNTNTSRMAITSGSSVTINDNVRNVYVQPASVLSSLAIKFPPLTNLVDQSIIEFVFGGTGTIAAGAPVVTLLSFVANSSQSLYQSITPTTASGGDVYRYKWDATTATWYRIVN